MEAKIGNILHPVADIDAAVRFYTTVFGLPIKFQDGNRYAALDGGGVTLALAAAGEDVTPSPAASVKVSDVALVVDQIVAAGGSVVTPAVEGPHEIRAVLNDPWGNTFIVYSGR